MPRDLIAEADETKEGSESITAPLDGAPPFVLTLEQYYTAAVGNLVVVDGDTKLTQIADPDDGLFLQVPSRRVGAIDYPFDLDSYRVALKAGQRYRVRVDSSLIDPHAWIETDEDWIQGDNSGGCLFGTNTELIYRTEHTRTYHVVVDSYSEICGYTLTIEPEES